MGHAYSGKDGGTYRIRVKNHLGCEWAHWFDGFAITPDGDEVMALTGEVVDQSALYGLLQKLQNLNLALLSIERIEPDQAGQNEGELE